MHYSFGRQWEPQGVSEETNRRLLMVSLNCHGGCFETLLGDWQSTPLRVSVRALAKSTHVCLCIYATSVSTEDTEFLIPWSWSYRLL